MVSLIVCVLVVFTVTFPKLTLAGTNEICAAFTVRVAALLVTFPTELLITTVNSAPLSELVADSVV